MRLLLAVTALSLATAFALRAQDVPAPVAPAAAQAGDSIPSIDPATLKVNKLRLAQPPAAVLLGNASMVVQRPSTPQILGLTLINAAGQGGRVPAGVAFETSPYWVFPHNPLMTTAEYERTSLANVYRRLSVSFATDRGDSVAGAAAPRASAAFGLRTNLVDQLRLTRRAQLRVDSTLTRLVAYSRRIEQASRRLREVPADPPINPTATKGRARLDSLERSINGRMQRHAITTGAAQAALADSLRAEIAERDRLAALYGGDAARLAANAAARSFYGARLTKALADSAAYRAHADSVFVQAQSDDAQAGFRLEAAAGWRTRFPNGAWNSARWDGVGLWVTPTYLAGDLPIRLQFTGIYRYLTRVQEYQGWNVQDVGGRADYVRSRLSIGGELVSRSLRRREAGTGIDQVIRVRRSSRWAVDVEYALYEGALLVGSFGSDFKRGSGQERPVISTLGLTFGLGAIGLRASETK